MTHEMPDLRVADGALIKLREDLWGFDGFPMACAQAHVNMATYQGRLDADRVTAAWRTRDPKRLDTGKRPIEESPLFGGERQGSLW